MNKNDFIFERLDNPETFKDYWFKVSGDTRKELTSKYMEQSMIEATEVVYSKKEDTIGVKRLFPFNYDVILPKDDELKAILKELSEEINNE